MPPASLSPRRSLPGCWLCVSLLACGRTSQGSRDAAAKMPDAGAELGADSGGDLAIDEATDLPADLGANVVRFETGVTVLPSVLPTPRHEPAVFSDGQAVFIAGGLDDSNLCLTQIVRFEPREGGVTVLPEVLPTASYAAGVAWTGTAAYLFGGIGHDGALRQIVRYEPSQGTATMMSAQLPLATYNVAAVWTGTAIYVFGGVAGGTHLNQILKYDPAMDSLSPLATVLPVGIEAPAAFWDGSLAWLLGGKADAAGSVSGTGANAIQVFDPATGQASLGGSLPYAAWDVPAFTDGRDFYLAGGYATTSTGHTSILRFDPVAKVASTLAIALPVRVSGRVGAWVAAVAAGYLCGGADFTTGQVSDRIVQVVP
jgi:hypothetical protein